MNFLKRQTSCVAVNGGTEIS